MKSHGERGKANRGSKGRKIKRVNGSELEKREVLTAGPAYRSS